MQSLMQSKEARTIISSDTGVEKKLHHNTLSTKTHPHNSCRNRCHPQSTVLILHVPRQRHGGLKHVLAPVGIHLKNNQVKWTRHK